MHFNIIRFQKSIFLGLTPFIGQVFFFKNPSFKIVMSWPAGGREGGRASGIGSRPRFNLSCKLSPLEKVGFDLSCKLYISFGENKP